MTSVSRCYIFHFRHVAQVGEEEGPVVVRVHAERLDGECEVVGDEPEQLAHQPGNRDGHEAASGPTTSQTTPVSRASGLASLSAA